MNDDRPITEESPDDGADPLREPTEAERDAADGGPGSGLLTHPAAIPRPHGPFARRLALAFATVAAITALLAALLISASWNYEFDKYVRDNLQRVADGIAQVAAEVYPLHGGWSIETLSAIPRFGPSRGIAVQITDRTDHLIYDDVTLYARMVNEQSTPGDEQELVVEPHGDVMTSPVVVDGVKVGTVHVWAYGAGAVMTERDLQFRQGSFAALTLAALVAILFASIAGIIYANRLVRPIEVITDTARALRAGVREARTGMDGDDEIAVLGRTFDEMADAIEADREMERRLTADVAHELRTPLQAIQATVEAMQDGVLPADEERLGIVRDETVRLARLADAILELTRLERGSLPFDMIAIDVAGPVRAAVESHAALLDAGELGVESLIADGLIVEGDPDRLQQAVGNLISNAARYTPSGGVVTVTVHGDGDRAVIEVDDTGIGIDEQHVERVFERFWRADDARARATGGLGIGLAVTKEIVERHRGSIIAQRLATGTRFTISLPLAQAQA